MMDLGRTSSLQSPSTAKAELSTAPNLNLKAPMESPKPLKQSQIANYRFSKT